MKAKRKPKAGRPKGLLRMDLIETALGRARVKAGLSRERAAELFGKSERTWTNWEREHWPAPPAALILMRAIASGAIRV